MSARVEGRIVHRAGAACARASGAALLALTGCQAPPEPGAAREHRLWVVDDGYHKGLLLPVELAPLRPDLQFPVDGSAPTYLEFGYSERDWILGTHRDLEHVRRLLVERGVGVLVVQAWADLETAVAGRHHCAYRCSEEQLGCLREAIAGWIDTGGSVGIREGATPMYVISSSRPYTLIHNCRWFADSLLRRMGIDDEDVVDVPSPRGG